MSKKVGRDNFDMDAETLSRFQQAVDLLGERGQAAKTIGISRDALQKAYHGHSSPKFEVVKRICLKANISLDWLATGRAEFRTEESDPWKLRSNLAFIYDMSKRPKIGDVAYFENENGKGLLGIIESESKETYTVVLVEHGRASKSKTQSINKKDLSGVFPAQMIRSFSDVV